MPLPVTVVAAISRLAATYHSDLLPTGWVPRAPVFLLIPWVLVAPTWPGSFPLSRPQQTQRPPLFPPRAGPASQSSPAHTRAVAAPRAGTLLKRLPVPDLVTRLQLTLAGQWEHLVTWQRPPFASGNRRWGLSLPLLPSAVPAAGGQPFRARPGLASLWGPSLGSWILGSKFSLPRWPGCLTADGRGRT